jgi:hypothetical protein
MGFFLIIKTLVLLKVRLVFFDSNRDKKIKKIFIGVNS